jgi:hypothetical protein
VRSAADHFLGFGGIILGLPLADADALAGGLADALPDADADADALAVALVVAAVVGLVEADVVAVVLGVVVEVVVVVALDAGAASVLSPPPQATTPITPPTNPRRTVSRFMGRDARMKRPSRTNISPQISRFFTFNAFSSMNCLRGST